MVLLFCFLGGTIISTSLLDNPISYIYFKNDFHSIISKVTDGYNQESVCIYIYRYKNDDSVRNSDFEFELNEALDLPDNTVCYIDDISIPHSWYSIEDFNNKLYIQRTYGGMRIDGTIITIPIGNYNASRLASTIRSLVQTKHRDPNYPDDDMTCTYENSRGTITFGATFEFQILFDLKAIALTTDYGNSFVWVDNSNEMAHIDMTDLRSINELIRHYSTEKNFGTTCESVFIDVLNVHNIYIHSNLSNYHSIGVRSESTIIKQSNSFN